MGSVSPCLGDWICCWPRRKRRKRRKEILEQVTGKATLRMIRRQRKESQGLKSDRIEKANKRQNTSMPLFQPTTLIIDKVMRFPHRFIRMQPPRPEQCRLFLFLSLYASRPFLRQQPPHSTGSPTLYQPAGYRL